MNKDQNGPNIDGVAKAIEAKTVTYDFERMMHDARLCTTSEFGDQIISHINES